LSAPYIRPIIFLGVLSTSYQPKAGKVTKSRRFGKRGEVFGWAFKNILSDPFYGFARSSTISLDNRREYAILPPVSTPGIDAFAGRWGNQPADMVNK